MEATKQFSVTSWRLLNSFNILNTLAPSSLEHDVFALRKRNETPQNISSHCLLSIKVSAKVFITEVHMPK